MRIQGLWFHGTNFRQLFSPAHELHELHIQDLEWTGRGRMQDSTSRKKKNWKVFPCRPESSTVVSVHRVRRFEQKILTMKYQIHYCQFTGILPVQIPPPNPSNAADCIWSVISSFSNLKRWSSSLGLFYHVPLKRDLGDWDWRLR